MFCFVFLRGLGGGLRRMLLNTLPEGWAQKVVNGNNITTRKSLILVFFFKRDILTMQKVCTFLDLKKPRKNVKRLPIT